LCQIGTVHDSTILSENSVLSCLKSQIATEWSTGLQ